MDEQKQNSSEASIPTQPTADIPAPTVAPKPRTTVTFSFNVWWLVVLLLAVIVLLIGLWRPWQGSGASARRITVSGSSTIKATPDEYTFNPSWEFKGSDKTATLKEVTDKSNAVVAEVKKLGVADKDIKTNTGGWGGYYYYDSTMNLHTYTLNVTITVEDRELSQKVQDYLTTTEPTGQVSPSATFSTALKKKLEQQGRTAATKDARAKADEMAHNLGFKVGKVVTIADNGTDGGISTMLSQGSGLDAGVKTATATLAVQPGQNDLTYTVQVVYAIR